MPVGEEVMDASLDAATAKIMGKLQPEDTMTSAELARQPRREEPDERGERGDDIEIQGETDLDRIETVERDKRIAGETEDDSGEGDRAAPEGGEDTFIELPASDGKEAERIPLAEAIEAVSKYRQIQGDIDAAVIRAEDEARGQHEKITEGLLQTFQTVQQHARTTLQAMQRYLPQPPDPIMLDENSGYYDPAGYHRAKLHYDGFVDQFRQIEAELTRAQQSEKATLSYSDKAHLDREMTRAARYIPEFKDETTRTAKQKEILDVLGPKYGLNANDVADFTDHRAWRILNDLAAMTKAQKAAPEVRKQLAEKTAKITKEGRVQQTRDEQTGRFVSEARKALKTERSEDAFAKYLLQSGALKGL